MSASSSAINGSAETAGDVVSTLHGRVQGFDQALLGAGWLSQCVGYVCQRNERPAVLPHAERLGKWQKKKKGV